MRAFALLFLLFLCRSCCCCCAALDVDSCYAMLSKAASHDAKSLDQRFLLCGVCNTQPFRFFLNERGSSNKVCDHHHVDGAAEEAISVVTNAVQDFAQSQGYFWLDSPGSAESNATQCLSHLLTHMPARDTMLLLTHPGQMVDFLFEHVRFALHTRASSPLYQSVPWKVFLDGVLPYAVIDEKRDLWWRWRPRMHQLFSPLVDAAHASNITHAMRVVVDALPTAQLDGAIAKGGLADYGAAVTWRSSTAPGFLSVEQVVQLGGSCTGTGIVTVAAARAVGIPARLAGCSESNVADDDHHWVEFWDDSSLGPFGDNWHTREGSSSGNPDGPWDSPSEPMNNCLKGVVAATQDRMHTIWASVWSGGEEMPMLWANTTRAAKVGHIGGENRCGAYCSAWGCGAKQDQHWTQAQCGVL